MTRRVRIDFAGSEGSEGMKVDNIKPQKIVFVSPAGHGVIVQERHLPMELDVSSMIKQCKFENVPFSVPGCAAWIGLAQRARTAKNEVCLLPKQLGEQVAKLQVRALWEREFMALVRAQVKALGFKRNDGIVKRSCDLLPVRPCRLQADNNDAHLLPESWMRNWRRCSPCLLCHGSACCVHGKRRWRCPECDHLVKRRKK